MAKAKPKKESTVRTSTTPSEKEDLARHIESIEEDPAADWQFLLLLYIAIAIVLLLLLPKIYLRNSIYYESRAIDRLQTQYDALTEEHKLLQHKVEGMKVKNQILDTIF